MFSCQDVVKDSRFDSVFDSKDLHETVIWPVESAIFDLEIRAESEKSMIVCESLINAQN